MSQAIQLNAQLPMVRQPQFLHKADSLTLSCIVSRDRRMPSLTPLPIRRRCSAGAPSRSVRWKRCISASSAKAKA